MSDLFDDFDTHEQCEEFYTEEDTFFCNEEVDGVCNGCGTCAVSDCADICPATGEEITLDDGQPTWEQEWEDFGEEGCESIEYL